MNIRHEKSNVYCPYCLAALTRVKKTGHLFCEASLINCDYEVSHNSRPPLSFEQCQGALRLRYTQQKKQTEKQIRRLNQEMVLLNEKIRSIEQFSTC